MSLVPAYAPCASPNRTHGPPLAFGSCNPPAQTSAQATVDFTIEHSWACVPSGSTSTGSTCDLHTILSSFIPRGLGPDGKRTLLELDAVRIYDGGTDGDGDTTADNTVFARPGIFIP